MAGTALLSFFGAEPGVAAGAAAGLPRLVSFPSEAAACRALPPLPPAVPGRDEAGEGDPGGDGLSTSTSALVPGIEPGSTVTPETAAAVAAAAASVAAAGLATAAAAASMGDCSRPSGSP